MLNFCDRLGESSVLQCPERRDSYQIFTSGGDPVRFRVKPLIQLLPVGGVCRDLF